MSTKGATALHSCTSSISSASTSCTVRVQLCTASRSGTRPPASMAVCSATRSSDAEPDVSARAVTACAVNAGALGQGRRVRVAA
jgi:hypothetical protein